MSTTARVTDAEWLTRAVRLAADNVARGGGPFGALIVRGDDELTTGTNQVTTSLDPTCRGRRDAASAGFDDRAFYDLFERPKGEWPVAVARVSVGDRNRPFADWLARPDRVAY
jgi:hypothetical protein